MSIIIHLLKKLFNMLLGKEGETEYDRYDYSLEGLYAEIETTLNNDDLENSEEDIMLTITKLENMLNGDEVEEAEFTDLYGKLTAKMQSCKKSSHIHLLAGPLS